jgi:hypothetical protein
MAESVSRLQKYYRLPGLQINLPSRGKYLPPNSINLTDEGQLNIYPMRLADEMMLKNPDALMSGSAVQSLFESCVPDILTPALISSPDVDVLLLAIRVATYGRSMELETTCPNCEKELAFDCNLPQMLQTIKDCSFDNEARLTSDLLVKVRPFNVADISFMSRKIFEEERRLQQIDMSDDLNEDQRQMQRNMLFKRMSNLQSEMLSHTIMSITTPEGEVTDPAELSAFLANIAAPWVKKIDDIQKEVGQGGLDKTIPVTCEYCQHEWKTAVDFDPTSFFEVSSSV